MRTDRRLEAAERPRGALDDRKWPLWLGIHAVALKLSGRRVVWSSWKEERWLQLAGRFK